MREKEIYRCWAIVYALMAAAQTGVLVRLVTACGVCETLVGVLCSVVLTANIIFLITGSIYLWKEGDQKE